MTGVYSPEVTTFGRAGNPVCIWLLAGFRRERRLLGAKVESSLQRPKEPPESVVARAARTRVSQKLVAISHIAC